MVLLLLIACATLLATVAVPAISQRSPVLRAQAPRAMTLTRPVRCGSLYAARAPTRGSSRNSTVSMRSASCAAYVRSQGPALRGKRQVGGYPLVPIEMRDTLPCFTVRPRAEAAWSPPTSARTNARLPEPEPVEQVPDGRDMPAPAAAGGRDGRRHSEWPIGARKRCACLSCAGSLRGYSCFWRTPGAHRDRTLGPSGRRCSMPRRP